MDASLWAPHLRREWEDEIRATEILRGPGGRLVRPERGDVDVIRVVGRLVPRRESTS